MQVHHIAIICSNRQKAIDFYVSALGMKIENDYVRPEKNDEIIMLSFGESNERIELFIKSNAPARPNYPEALGLRHLAFRVESVEKVVADLREKGVISEEIRFDTFDNKKMTFIHDPDGLPIELHE